MKFTFLIRISSSSTCCTLELNLATLSRTIMRPPNGTYLGYFVWRNILCLRLMFCLVWGGLCLTCLGFHNLIVWLQGPIVRKVQISLCLSPALSKVFLPQLQPPGLFEQSATHPGHCFDIFEQTNWCQLSVQK